MKIHNLSIRKAALEFNMSYCILSHYCKKIPEHVTINLETCDNLLHNHIFIYPANTMLNVTYMLVVISHSTM